MAGLAPTAAAAAAAAAELPQEASFVANGWLVAPTAAAAELPQEASLPPTAGLAPMLASTAGETHANRFIFTAHEVWHAICNPAPHGEGMSTQESAAEMLDPRFP